MTGQPPNKMSQSPERGRQASLRKTGATNGRLAGAATMLTHGVNGLWPLHHWRDGLHSRHTQCDLVKNRRQKHSCYSRAVKGLVCSFANQERPCLDFRQMVEARYRRDSS